jgi:hypothetical protein
MCRAGSIPAPGTINESLQKISMEAFFIVKGGGFFSDRNFEDIESS